jgi:hypothetical protein
MSGTPTNSSIPSTRSRIPRHYQAFTESLPPELVSPVVAYLAHELCDVSGMLFDVGGGSVATYLGATAGIFDQALTIETVETGWVRSSIAPGCVVSDPLSPEGSRTRWQRCSFASRTDRLTPSPPVGVS